VITHLLLRFDWESIACQARPSGYEGFGTHVLQIRMLAAATLAQGRHLLK
jgi:hypothetical protein